MDTTLTITDTVHTGMDSGMDTMPEEEATTMIGTIMTIMMFITGTVVRWVAMEADKAETVHQTAQEQLHVQTN